MPFDHERLDVYPLTLEFLSIADGVIARMPRGWKYLADQLQRAASSIVLNVSEGAAKFAPADKAVFYTRARASTGESAAVLDSCAKLRIISPSALSTGKALLDRIGRMLTGLIQTQLRRQSKPQPQPQPKPQPDPEPETPK
jgi:four helix bundle protein